MAKTNDVTISASDLAALKALAAKGEAALADEAAKAKAKALKDVPHFTILDSFKGAQMIMINCPNRRPFRISLNKAAQIALVWGEDSKLADHANKHDF